MDQFVVYSKASLSQISGGKKKKKPGMAYWGKCTLFVSAGGIIGSAGGLGWGTVGGIMTGAASGC